jgi:hypothetical protein
MPPGPAVLHVAGEVLVNSPGHRAVLTIKEPQGSNPEILLLDLTVLPLEGFHSQVLTWVVVRFELVLGPHRRYEQVQIIDANGRETTVDVEDVH